MNQKHAEFLLSSEYINWQHPLVLKLAKELAQNGKNKTQIAERCFRFVRDQINHSYDFQQNPITCKASDVLFHKTGYCYAKSHLLAALLRANGIAAGLCYQRLTITDVPPFCLHGLNAVHLEEFGWYRMDARGNKPGVNAEFCPPTERLAFNMVTKGEANFPGVYSNPLDVVIDTLHSYSTYQEVANNLPDVALAK